MPAPPVSRRFSWQALVIAVLTVGLLALFLRSVDLRKAWEALLNAHLLWIAAAIGTTLVTYLLRSWRWQVLLEPIGAVSFRSSFRATVIGFAGNLLLPARAGELIRAYVIGHHERVNVASAFATVIVERLLDLVTVLLLFASGILFSGIDVGPTIATAGGVAAAGAVAALIVLFLLAGHPERVGRVADRLAGRLPARLATLVGQLVRTLTSGLRVMRSPSHFALALAWSVPIWISIAIGIMFISWAFDLKLALQGAFLVIGYLTVGVSVPTPGAAGGFHYFYKLAMTQFFGASDSDAGAAAIVLHLVSFGPVTLVGLLFMWQDGLSLGGLRKMKDEAQAETKSGEP
jgi:uncharacterized protein (TIRG00374 family)